MKQSVNEAFTPASLAWSVTIKRGGSKFDCPLLDFEPWVGRRRSGPGGLGGATGRGPPICSPTICILQVTGWQKKGAWLEGWGNWVEVRLREMRFDDDDDGLVVASLYVLFTFLATANLRLKKR